jgi:16S rRNA U1498 N3-methylase RsmE
MKKKNVEECECGDYYLEALEQARRGLVDRARQIMKLEDRLQEVTEERDLAWACCENLVQSQKEILDDVQENILLQRTRRLTVRDVTDSDSSSASSESD